MKKILGTLVFILFVGINWASAQCPWVSPEPTCIRVLPNGDVEIDFDRATMDIGSGQPTPLQIDAFTLEYSATGAAGTFVPVPASTILVPGPGWPAATFFTHAGANANNQDAFYRIIAICTGAPPAPLPTSSIIRAVRLKADITNDFEVNLSWNWDTLSTTFVSIDINKARPHTAAYQYLNSVNFVQGDLSYTDTVIACLDSVKYQIIYNKNNVCQTESSELTVRVEDLTPPDVPVIDSLSFDEATNRPLFTWDENPQLDTRGYVAFFHPNGDCQNWFVVDDTIFGRTNNQVLDNQHYNGINSAQYSVFAFDQCGLTSQTTECANTIQLTTQLDQCEKSVRLDWTSYPYFNSGPDVLYKIFARIGGSAYVFVDQTTDNFYIHEVPIQNVIYTYKIVAVENDGAGPRTTSSNRVEVDAEFLKQPEYSYLRFVTVEDINEVRMEFLTDTKNDASTYYLKRTLDTNDVFETVNIFRAPEPKIASDSIMFFNDRSPITDRFQYYYRLESFDSCGAAMDTSNFVSTMLLKVEVDNVRRVNRLEWTNVNGWFGKTFAYRIYRFLDGQPLKDPLTKFPDSAATTVYYDSLLLINDNVTFGQPSRGEYCYYIEAIENEPSFRGLKPATSISNEVCVVQQPYISSPNSFTPNGDGKNDTFRPVLTYHDIDNYEFYIMNRYGDIIYETRSPKASWDGTLDGKFVPAGVYVYSVKYRASTGEQFEQVGSITVYR